MRTRWIAAIVTTCALSWGPAAVAKPGPHGKGHEKREKAEQKSEHAQQPVAQPVVVIDRDGDRRIALDYFDRSGLPPGLARQQSLPPGLARQLRERGRLPPGLEKRLVPVPSPLSARFRPMPSYYNRYYAGRDLLIVDRRSNTIVGIIPDALPRR